MNYPMVGTVMPAPKMTPKLMRFPPAMMVRIDDARRHEADMPNQAEFIRRLVEWALDNRQSGSAG